MINYFFIEDFDSIRRVLNVYVSEIARGRGWGARRDESLLNMTKMPKYDKMVESFKKYQEPNDR